MHDRKSRMLCCQQLSVQRARSVSSAGLVAASAASTIARPASFATSSKPSPNAGSGAHCHQFLFPVRHLLS